jgi:hypothetical protein
MSDREVIIRLLERAERRNRSNRRLGQIAAILCISLLIPVGFKALDLIFHFRGRTVSAVLIVWAVVTFAFIVWRTRGRHSLSQIAASIDRKAHLQDQLKTAYWFIGNPRSSEWVDVQIQRAAQQVQKLSLENLYPRRVPRGLFYAAGLLALLIGLNFVPLSLNYNWVYLQAAPPFRLTDEEQKSLGETRRLLQKAALENQEIAERIDEIIEDLEQGEIGIDEAIDQLEALQQQLEEGNLDLANLTNGIEEMAAILAQSQQLKPMAAAMAEGQLAQAASELREFSKGLQDVAPPDLRTIEQRFQQASENPRPGLEDLARAFESSSMALARGDRTAAVSAMDRAARELERLMKEIEGQQALNDAGEELGELASSLQEREGGEGGYDDNDPYSEEGDPQGASANGQAGDQQQPGEGPGEFTEGGEPGETSEGEGGGEGGEGSEAGAGRGQSGGQNGRGGNSFGGSTESAPVAGDPTSLEVQLRKELLEMKGGPGNEPARDEAAGERERSKLDYRNVPSELSPAQKDLLNQEQIPWESRQLIKDYFQAVKPQDKK